MKKVVLFLISVCLLCGCSVKEREKLSTLQNGVDLIFETITDYHTIYEYSDGMKIITGYELLKYTNYDKDGKTYLLEDAIKNNIITIDDYIKRFKLIEEKENYKLYLTANDVYLADCGNIVIGNSADVVNYCSQFLNL